MLLITFAEESLTPSGDSLWLVLVIGLAVIFVAKTLIKKLTGRKTDRPTWRKALLWPLFQGED